MSTTRTINNDSEVKKTIPKETKTGNFLAIYTQYYPHCISMSTLCNV